MGANEPSACNHWTLLRADVSKLHPQPNQCKHHGSTDLCGQALSKHAHTPVGPGCLHSTSSWPINTTCRQWSRTIMCRDQQRQD